MFTGALSITRNKAQELVEDLGGVAGNSVCSTTDILVVGSAPGSKLFKAQSLGISILDEDKFWALIEQARVAEEDWSSIKGVITEDTLVKVLEKLQEQKEARQLKGENLPPIETMSYYSRENLEKFLTENPGIYPKTDERICPNCGNEILYSISTVSIYCFKCKLYSGPGRNPRHTCLEWERMDIEAGDGFYQKCKLCGNVEFVGNAEVVERQMSLRLCNFYNSLEFLKEVYTNRPQVPQTDITRKFNTSELSELEAVFSDWIDKQVTKGENKRKRRDAKFKQKRESNPATNFLPK